MSFVLYTVYQKKLTAKKILWYESLKSKPTSMKCTALRNSKKHSWKVYIYKHARNLTKSRLSEAEETGLSNGLLDIISESQWNKASFLNI